MSESNVKVFAEASGKDSLNVPGWVMGLCIGTAALCAVLYLASPSQTRARARGSSTNAGNRPAAALTKVPLRTGPPAAPANRKAVFQALAQQPLSFERNVGQANPGVEFVSRGAGYSLALSRKDAVLSVLTRDTRKGIAEHNAPARITALRMALAGANPSAAITGLEPLPDKVNYLIGKDPRQWKLHVPHYARVKYEGVYRGIDLVYYGNQRQLEYDFVIAPGADPNQIQLSFGGAENLRLDPATGDLVITTAHNGEFRHRRPAVYQMFGSTRIKIDGSYRVLDRKHAAFAIASYDARNALVIDPTLDFLTSFGGSSLENVVGVSVDNAGNAYVAGVTLSLDFPQVGIPPKASGCTFTIHPLAEPVEPSIPLQLRSNVVTPDAAAAASTTTCASPFVAKISPAGKILFSTYFGGDSSTSALGIAADSTGVFITGGTSDKDFLTNTDYAFGGHNAYVADLDPSGESFHWIVGLGGGTANVECTLPTGGVVPCGYNFSLAVTLDAQHNAYIAGYTTSEDFPTTEYFQGQHKSWQPTVGWIRTGCTATAKAITGFPCQDGFVAKVPSTGNFNDGGYSTYIGGSVFDRVQAIAVDSTGHAYVTGLTYSYDFPALASSAGGAPGGGGVTAFVTKLLADGSGAMYSNFLGGKEDATDGPPEDTGNGIALDWFGEAYVAGATCSNNFPVTPGGYSQFAPCTATTPGFSGFVSVLSPLGSLTHSTLFGGPAPVGESFAMTVANSIAINSLAEVYVGGRTSAVNILGTPNPYQSEYDNGLLMEFSPTLRPLSINFIGGIGSTVNSVAVQPPGSGILGILLSQLFTQVYAAGDLTKSGSDPGTQFSSDAFVSKWTDFHAVAVFRAQF